MSDNAILPPSRGRFYAVRFKPGEDLLAGLRAFVAERDLQAVSIVTAVGSLTKAPLRLANTGVWETRQGHFEIVSLVGTIDAAGEHIHISLSDRHGVTVGAHFGPGSAVYTTAEVVLVELEDYRFSRESCALSGYDELIVASRDSR
ncbi:conserved hypothetical protein [uncultured Pleomorphomonas sp.]|uniref:PPC domain-containing protein n=1 Tax=uncultured Pleomorphomonas sp. TaxID=442121 RepID=A0A212LET3_9HYPH|nr:PPC domain-containing DNA-binding protein [uncultured Pleomorphomonas sp.]SCM75987.1 conserved hypothetical protein [uncultured Pleomorphomonas sp.]